METVMSFIMAPFYMLCRLFGSTRGDLKGIPNPLIRRAYVVVFLATVGTPMIILMAVLVALAEAYDTIKDNYGAILGAWNGAD